jgi:hypothetical protein
VAQIDVAPSGKDWLSDHGERFFRTRANQSGLAESRAMIDREHNLPITASQGTQFQPRCGVLRAKRRIARGLSAHAVNRSAAYRASLPGRTWLTPRATGPGAAGGRRHIGTLKQRMGIEAVCAKPGMSMKCPGYLSYRTWYAIDPSHTTMMYGCLFARKTAPRFARNIDPAGWFMNYRWFCG